ncbi:MAG: rhodanese-related sulfurtransferase [Pseudomonadales bacterium]|jgi:UPF0176 protein
MEENSIVVCALYHFVRLDNFEELREPLVKLMEEQSVRGTLLLAHEGINGTIAGAQAGIDSVLDWLKNDKRFSELRCKESYTDEMPFNRSKVKLKKEIVTMGVEDIDPNNIVGSYTKPEDWNALISDPDVTLIDTRNEYEIQIGTFTNAINPHTTSFREFPEYAKAHLDPSTHKKVAMFCTGGIRCEKSTAYLKALGFEEVYHLEGGILKYLEDVPEEESLWQGECFVFDDRVTVDHNLEKGKYDQCHACRMPVTEQDKLSNAWIQGVSCPYCIGKQTEEQKKRFREREKQVQLARKRGETHIGADAVSAQQKNKITKAEQKRLQRSQG